MILIGKIVLFSLFAATINLTNVHEIAYPSAAEKASFRVQTGGTIVTDEYMLSVDLNDNQDKMATLSVKDALQEEVFFDDTCNNAACEYDLSSLAAGTYTVYVTTQGSDSFSDNITL